LRIENLFYWGRRERFEFFPLWRGIKGEELAFYLLPLPPPKGDIG